MEDRGPRADHQGDAKKEIPMSRCDRCRSDDLFRVQLAPRGKSVLHATCRDCEHRWWEDLESSQPQVIALSDVLAQIATR